jgi:hypothetical protein
MKKLFLLLFLLLTGSAFTQDADTSDYFRIGLYGGSYIAQFPLYEKNQFANSIALETEYVKFKNLSFYIKGLYEFTNVNLNNLYKYYDYNILSSDPPNSYRLLISLGGRYYLREKNIRPYLQLGINHESDYISDFTYYYDFGRGYKSNIYSQKCGWFYFLSMNIGVGVNIKLSKNLCADIQYDIQRNLEDKGYTFQGFSVLAGLKYNIIY